MAETADAPEVARQDPNGGAIDCKQVRRFARTYTIRTIRDRSITRSLLARTILDELLDLAAQAAFFFCFPETGDFRYTCYIWISPSRDPCRR